MSSKAIISFFTMATLVHLTAGKPSNSNSDFVRYPSEASGNLVEGWSAESKVNPEEMGEYLEGDIIIGTSRNGLLDESLRWANATVPYVIAGPYGREDLDTIFAAMDLYHRNTCVRFRRRTEADPDYLRVQNTHTGCWSEVGRSGAGRQDLNLQSPGCLAKVGTAVHELMHALGFHHEQARADRDAHVAVRWENIEAGREGNFRKLGDGVSTAFGVGYDYGSVMHYSAYAFSKNQRATIEPKVSGVKIGQRKGFSVGDLKKVNSMYNCKDVDVGNLAVEKPDYNIVNSNNNIITDLVNTIFG